MDPSSRPRRLDAGSKEPGGRRAPARAGDSEAVARAVRDFQNGADREESFRVLFETYRGTVHTFFLRRLGSADLAHDLTQETFLKVYKGLKGFRGDAPFGAWLFRIAWNVLRGRCTGSAATRLRAREVGLEDLGTEVRQSASDGSEVGPRGEPPALTSVLREERRRVLRGAIERLPLQRRRCVVLWAYHELTYEQIAVVMRIALGTVKAHLAQARQQLVQLLAEDAGGVER